MIRIKVSGGRRLKDTLKRLESEQRRALAGALSESLEEVRREARNALQQGPSPKSRTGELADSLFVRVDPDGLGGEVGTDVPHGRHLEFGTRRMPARPWLQPAFERLKPRIRARLASAVREANRKAARGGGGPAGAAGDLGA